MKHKKILFDEIYAPSEAEQKQKEYRKHNRRAVIFGNVFKFLLIAVLSIAGSVLLTILFTALMQNKPPEDIIKDIVSNAKNIF